MRKITAAIRQRRLDRINAIRAAAIANVAAIRAA